MLKLLVVVIVFAVVTYVALRLMERGRPPGSRHHPSGTRRPAPRPVAPDDDDDFLRGLDRKRRKDPPD